MNAAQYKIKVNQLFGMHGPKQQKLNMVAIKDNMYE